MDAVRERLLHWNQHKLLDHVNKEPTSRQRILHQLQAMGVDRIFEDFHKTMTKYRSLKQEGVAKKFCPPVFLQTAPFKSKDTTALGDEIKASIEAANKPAVLFRKAEMSESFKQNVIEEGMKVMREGKLGCVLLAGGQGSRLKFDGPKGCYRLDALPARSTIFQLILERLVALKHLSGASSIPLYIMVSQQNAAATRTHLEENQYFGLPKKDVILFEQTVMPSFSEEGEALLESPDSLTQNPNGNGGLFVSLQQSGNVDDMEKRGVKFVHVIGVDNILVKICDPLFIGMCVLADVPVGNKCVAKVDPSEKVGVQAYSEEITAEGKEVRKPCVVEYTEITEEQAHMRIDPKDEHSDLLFSAGNICNHFFTLNHIHKVLTHPEFEYHVAIKNLKVYDPVKASPTTVTGIKLEYFIFDSFLPAECVLALEARRDEEFSPVKNYEGSDSPATAVRDLLTLHRRYLQAAGVNVDCPKCQIVADTYQGEGLERYKEKNASELSGVVAISQ